MASGKPEACMELAIKESVRERKAPLIRRYEGMVGTEGARRARANLHSRRKPIQCGLTIHTGRDCAYSCTYCYILDMGFKFRSPIPCELSPEELALSLLYNSNFTPGRNGTYIAIGSVVEPFQPELKSLTIKYIAELAKLSNPMQFSTKSHLTGKEARTIQDSCSWISPLVTILTTDEAKAKLLEPFAPTPIERMDTISNLAEARLKPFLFLRPVIPGIMTIDENTRLIEDAVRRGACGVVLGNLRITRRIFNALRSKGFDVSEIAKRVKTIDATQRTVQLSDIQKKIEEQVSNLTIVYRRSCCASAFSSGLEKCAHEQLKPLPT